MSDLQPTGPEAPRPVLTLRQQAVVEAYLGEANADATAARIAGYKNNPDQNHVVTLWLSKVDIRAYLRTLHDLCKRSAGSTEFEEFDRLLSEATGVCDQRLASTYDFEPAFVRLLEYTLQHPEVREHAVQQFLLFLLPGCGGGVGYCPELVPFCMHKLRWEEVYGVVNEWAATAYANDDMRSLPVFSDILQAYADEWDDASMYQYYKAA